MSVRKWGVWLVGGREIRSECEEVGSVAGTKEGG